MYCFILPQNACSRHCGTNLKPAVRNSIWVSHKVGRDSSTGAIYCFSECTSAGNWIRSGGRSLSHTFHIEYRCSEWQLCPKICPMLGPLNTLSSLQVTEAVVRQHPITISGLKKINSTPARAGRDDTGTHWHLVCIHSVNACYGW